MGEIYDMLIRLAKTHPEIAIPVTAAIAWSLRGYVSKLKPTGEAGFWKNLGLFQMKKIAETGCCTKDDVKDSAFAGATVLNAALDTMQPKSQKRVPLARKLLAGAVEGVPGGPVAVAGVKLVGGWLTRRRERRRLKKLAQGRQG